MQKAIDYVSKWDLKLYSELNDPSKCVRSQKEYYELDMLRISKNVDTPKIDRVTTPKQQQQI